MKKLKLWKKIAVVLLLLAVLAGIGFSLYVGMYYHALPQEIGRASCRERVS